MNRWTSEWLLLRRDRTAWLVYALFALACVCAVADSVASYRRERALQDALASEEAARIEALQQALATPSTSPVPSWLDPRNAGSVGRGRAATYAALPLGDLGAVRSHQSAISAVSVSTEGGVLDRALGQLVQPHTQSLGRFDLGFLLIVVLPLVVLLLCFDVVARDHERGTVRFLFAQEANAAARYVVRVVLRLVPIVAMTFASVAVAVALTGRLSAAALPGLAVVFVVVALYATFWSSIALVVQSWFRTATASGIVSLAAWSAFVVLLPTVLSAIAEAAEPIPSRIERTSASREASRRASAEAAGLLSRYLEDHPELVTGKADTSDYYVRRVAVDDAVAASRAPVERRFFDAVERRGLLTRRLTLASPASLVALALDEVAGTSDEQVARFRREVDAFQAQFAEFFNEKTIRGEPLSVSSLAARPTFRFEARRGLIWPLFALALWALAMIALASRRMQRAVAIDQPAPSSVLAAQR